MPGRTIVSVAGAGGRPPLANAFLRTGCAAYIGAIEGVDDTSALQFVNLFIYFLLESEREPSLKCTELEAVERASRIDGAFQEGTCLFRYYVISS